jgi:CRP/FNR family cyclic AMP-dependent transcriptional regulator
VSKLPARAVAGVALSGPRAPDGRGLDWVPVLGEVPLFRGLAKRHLRRIARLGRVRRFAPGAAIVRAGDRGMSFYVLLDGEARVVPRSGPRSRLKAGDCFGEMALLDESPRSADVVAESDVLSLTINRSAFTKLLRGEPELARALLRTLAARLRTAEAPV